MQILVKAFSVLVMSAIGLVIGAFVSYFVAGLIYIAVFGSGPAANSYECARGMAFGWLSLLAGALAGLCLGGCLGVCWGDRFFERGNGGCQSN